MPVVTAGRHQCGRGGVLGELSTATPVGPQIGLHVHMRDPAGVTYSRAATYAVADLVYVRHERKCVP